MENLDQIISTLSMTMGAAWASGINLYATLLVLGIMGTTGNIVLPENLHILMDPLVMGAAGVMYFVEFVADKTPGVDTGWDAIHTFVRIPAGVMLAAGAVGEVNTSVAVCRSHSRGRSCRQLPCGQGRFPGVDQHFSGTLFQLDCLHPGRCGGGGGHMGILDPSLDFYSAAGLFYCTFDLAHAKAVAGN